MTFLCIKIIKICYFWNMLYALCDFFRISVHNQFCFYFEFFCQLSVLATSRVPQTNRPVLALDLEGVHDVKLHHPSSSVATSNQ